MARTAVALRDAVVEDAPFLAELWAGSLRRADVAEHYADVERIIKDAARSPEQRVVVAEYDGALAGAAFLKLATVTPLNLEPCVFVVSPHVVDTYRRHGVGRTLMEAAVAFAEETGATAISTAVAAGAREPNRFMARLGLGPLATYRTAPTSLVGGKLAARRPTMAAPGSGRQVTRVLAARRSMRRAAESD